ncbi:MAG: T9SS type A sorting domain-containing protein [Ignavibacteriaceae bacterium]|nr:T9SS type A sorting domain-containing protein [Ignavibacteriaceae bacterium]MCW8824762.1 T9SS type A sorting domain-containing protein [Ignavibacteriaceae bacterium]MCW9095203.1 T9SS type A sorting domain-containing protein [Ignavibacteriaceae bacterium]
MKKFYILLTIFSLLFVPSLYAQWSNDPNTNLIISDMNGEQVLPKISLTSDGGCYIAWFDTRTGNYNVYLQRLDPAGNKMFATDGLLISDNPSNTWIVDWDMMADNSDNAVIAFSDIRAGGDFKVYAYLISPTGDFLWGADGVSLSTAADMQPNPSITQTTDGYYIIAWPNLSTPSEIAVQKLDAAGNKLYGNDPMYISSGTNEQYTYPIPIPGVNGSYIIGFEGTTGSFPGLTVHLYAQKYSSAGTPQWGSSPVTVCDAGGFPFYELTNIIPDGNFGVVFVWYDDRDFNNNYSTFVQRVDSSGSVLFTANGVEASSLASNQHLNCDVVIDPSTYEIYAFWIEQDNLQSMAGISGQKFSITGTKLWGNNGMTFKAMDSNTDLHMSALFEGGNEYVYYLEYIGATQNNLAKAFSVDGNGNFNWTGNIVTFSSVVSSKSRLVSDVYSNGASVLAWSDGRQDNGGIYAQDIQVDGSFGGIVPVELLSFTAGLNSGIVTLNWVTATETNNKGFEVERLQNYKITGLQYWEIIGFIPGYGTTTETHSYSFEDNNLKQGNYQYRLKQIDFDGSFKYSDIVKVEISAPVEFSLEQNFPNPFNPSTSIQYAISGKQFVSLKIYDLLGNEITTLVNEEKPIGKYEVEFNATGLPSGIYFYKLQAGDFIQTKKMILMK